MGFHELAAAIDDRIRDYRRTGDIRVLLADAVQSEVDALLEVAEQEQVAEVRQLLGTLFFLRFDAVPQGDLADLARALLFHWSAGAGAAPEPLRALLPGPDRDVNLQLDVAAALFRHSLSNSVLSGLQVTIVLLEDAVDAIPPWRQDRRAPLSQLINAKLCWHRLTGDQRAADEAIALAERCLDSLTTQHPDRWWFLAAVAMARVGKVLRGAMSDIREAIDLGEQALAAREQAADRTTLDGADDGMVPLLTLLKVGLGFTYEFRYSLSLAPADLDRSIALREAAALDWADPDLVAAIAKGRLARFDRTGDLPDLRQAVAAAKRFLAVADADDPNHDLAAALVAVAHRIPRGRRFRPRTPVPDRGGFLKRLWLERLVRAREPDAVIVLGETALSVTGMSPGLNETVLVPSPEDPATDRTLIRLSEAYVERFSELGHKPDIDRAVALLELMRSPAGSDDMRKAGRAYHVRFTISNSKDDLEHAVWAYETALREMADDDPHRYRATYHLTDAYRTAFGISGDEDYLRRGTDLAEQALARMRAKDPARAVLLVALADICSSRFYLSRDAGDLARAVELLRQAVAIDRDASTLGSLGDAYFLRFDKLGDPDDLLLAIDAFGEAMAMTQENTTIWMYAVAKYCAAYRELFTVFPKAVDAEVVKKLAKMCTEASHGLPVHKALACHSIGSLALAMGRPRTAIRVLDEAVGLLRTATWRDTGWSEQETYLRDLRSLASDSVAAYLAVGDPAAAVTAAERGRAVTLGAELDLRADVTGLARIHPALARRFDEVRDRLGTQDRYDLVGAARDTVGRNNRNNLWTEHDRLVEEARQLPGFASFLRPPRLADLQPAAEGGAVVLVNAAESRGDAIIVTSIGQPVAVPLPRLTIDDLRRYATDLLHAVTATPLTRSLQARRVLTDVLGWLWESTVEPVITAMSGTQPRIWWLPTGMLGLFPLHAAGVTGQPGALDLAVSSYVPSLRALHHARHRARPATRKQLTVALGDTPGFPPIPGTTAEAAALRARHPDHPLLTDADATPRSVLSALSDCTWAHFACHASADPATSARAVLHLRGGDLPVEAISRLRLEAAELAYLSACSTAARGLRADEPTNLASAFHLAGFRHVVATLWPLTDSAAAHAAQAFYDTLGDAPTADDTAHTVRAVARELRTRHPHRPDLWAALIHSGP